MLFFIFFIALFSSISIIDYNITILLMKIPTKKFSSFFSKNIIYINIIFNLYLLFYSNISKLFILKRYFIDLFIINFCFKWCLDRKRPNTSIYKKFNSIFDITISKKWKINQSFPSGHLSTIFNTYLLIIKLNNQYLNNLYLIFTILTFYSRINLGAHHLSDCIFSLFLSLFFNKIITDF